jgi:hypothetical protein
MCVKMETKGNVFILKVVEVFARGNCGVGGHGREGWGGT